MTAVRNRRRLEPIHYPTVGSEIALLERLVEALLSPQDEVVVDLGDAPMVSSTALTALRRLGTMLRARGGELTVRSSHPGLVRLLDLSLLSASFTLERTTMPREDLRSADQRSRPLGRRPARSCDLAQRSRS